MRRVREAELAKPTFLLRALLCHEKQRKRLHRQSKSKLRCQQRSACNPPHPQTYHDVCVVIFWQSRTRQARQREKPLSSTPAPATCTWGSPPTALLRPSRTSLPTDHVIRSSRRLMKQAIAQARVSC